MSGEPKADTGQSSDATGSLVNLLSRRAPKVALALAATQAALPIVKWVQSKGKERVTYTVTVAGGDEVYDDLHEWLLSLFPEKHRRSLLAYSTAKRRTDDLDAPSTGVKDGEESSDDRPIPKMRFRYDGARVQTVTIDGQRIRVKVEEGTEVHDQGTFFTLKPPKLVFAASSSRGRDALRAHMDELLRIRHTQQRPPAFKMARSWGSWDRLDHVPPRRLDTVILPSDQRARLVGDLEEFLASEEEYVERCMPWHRGYLFEGQPGTGKTSVAKALANHFGMDVFYMPLSDVPRDSTLLSLVANVEPRSLLLLEDIDVFHAATERDDDKDVTLSGLLNALDGITTPHGLITIMTTNEPDVLDPALVRPGRVDLIERFELAEAQQVRDLFSWFYDKPFPGQPPAQSLSPAAVIGAMHKHKDDPDLAADAIRALV